MSMHVTTDPTATDPASDPSVPPGWLPLSAALADEVPMIADREDLMVHVAPGAAHGHAACLLMDQARIEINGEHVPIDPATARPWRVDDRTRYPTAWGLLVHECAHARHSEWQAPPDTPAGMLAAAELLEESRIEAAQIRRRPDDRHWLRAAAAKIIIEDSHLSDPARAPKMTTASAAQAAGLILARNDAGILTDDETAPVAAAVRTVLGAEKLAALRELWRAAHRVADDDADSMLELAGRWCDTLGLDTNTDPNADPGASPDTGMAKGSGTASGDPGSTVGDGSGTPEPPSPLASALADTLARVTVTVASEPVPQDPASLAAAASKAERRAANKAAAAADQVFGRRHGSAPLMDTRRAGRTRLAGTRPPATAERVAARQLARALDTAGVRDRVPTKTTSALPPGRLRMRGAMARDAQRAAGALPTAEPFTRTTRRTVPAPPLRIGIACDVSGSMGSVADSVAATAWILAHAAKHARVPATTATVIFGNKVKPITRPGTAPAEVTLFDSHDKVHDIATAIDALDGALQLSHPDAARLLVIVSDGHFHDIDTRAGQPRVNRLRAAGCGVLWLAPDNGLIPTPFDGTTLHHLTDPTATAQAVGHAATAALRAATR